MELFCVGYHHPHGADFEIERPYGLGSWTFLLIKTPALFKIDGKEIEAKKNSFIIYSKNMPQYYKAIKKEYIDDWFHFDVTKEDEKLFKSLNIPINKVVSVDNSTELSDIIRNMTNDFYSENSFKVDVADLYLKLLFLKLGTILENKRKYNSKSSYTIVQLANLRSSIYNFPHLHRTIDSMADELSMSRSTLQHKYKDAFGVSITDEIIQSRIMRSEFFLRTTNLPLSEIATQCGYNDEMYFMRQFKAKNGITPTEFRKKTNE